MEENTNFENNTSNNQDNNSKKVIYVIIAILVIAGLAFAIKQYQNKQQEIANTALKDIVNLPEKERIKALEAQVDELKNQAKNFAQDADAGTKYTVLIRLAEAQIQLDKFQEGLDTLNSIEEGKRGNSRVKLDYGLAYKGLNDTGKANEFLKQSIDMDDTNPQAWLPYLEANNDLPNDQLKAMYLQAIAGTKSNPEIMVSYAKFSEKIGDKATAIAAYETARNGNPEKTDEYNNEIQRLKQ
jgi:predicted negative regulator of RcsB-dependent stress response